MYLKTYESFGNEPSVDALDYEEFSQLVYGSGGMPNDKTIFDRIKYLAPQDFGWNAKDVNPYFITLKINNKIIGVVKIGEFPYKPERRYSVVYFSIDEKYQGKGYSHLLADKLFKFIKEKGYSLDTSGYSDIGDKVLRNIFKTYSDKYNVEFIDNPDKI